MKADIIMDKIKKELKTKFKVRESYPNTFSRVLELDKRYYLFIALFKNVSHRGKYCSDHWRITMDIREVNGNRVEELTEYEINGEDELRMISGLGEVITKDIAERF